MNRLPSEILLMIFGFVDDHREKTRLERVCKRWQKILLKDGWKGVRQIKLHEQRRIEPIAMRFGRFLVECCFDSVDIDSTLIRLITQQFRALKHLEFRSCILKELDANLMETLPEFGSRLISLNFLYMNDPHHLSHHFLCHFHLRHLGLSIYQQSLPNHFFADLRSLQLSHLDVDVGPMLERVQRDSPRLVALYLSGTIKGFPQQLMEQISILKSLRFLRLDYFAGLDLLGSCLNRLPQLLGLQLILPLEQLSALFRSARLRDLVHLSLYLYRKPFNHFESIGLLSALAPRLRSFHLEIPSVQLLDTTQRIGCEVLKMAHNGNLEHLNVPYASFTPEKLGQLVQLCPNLHSLGVPRGQLEDSHFIGLRQIVMDQWRTGVRKHLPLRIWVYDKWARCVSSWRDSFLAIHPVQYGFAPPKNPVFDELFRDLVFNEGGGAPLFLAEEYSSKSV